MIKALSPGRTVTSAQVWPLLPGTAAGADMEFNCKNTFSPQSAQSGQLQLSCLDSLTLSGFSRDVEMPTLPTGDGHICRISQGSQFALGIPRLLSSCDMFRCLMSLCRDAAQGFVPPNYLLFNFCFLLKVLPVPGKMSS